MLHHSFDLTRCASLFLTFAQSRGGPALLVEESAALRAAISRVQLAHPFRSDACVILPGRMLCVWTLPVGDIDIASRWLAVRRDFARSLGPGRLRWQRPEPPRLLTTVTDYAEAVRACWFAPVTLGLAARPEDWACSSIHDDETPGRFAA